MSVYSEANGTRNHALPSFAKAPARQAANPEILPECTDRESLCSPLVLATAAADLVSR